MIRINLLPSEFKKRERAPIQQPIVLGVCIAVNAILVGVLLWQLLVIEPAAKRWRDKSQAELQATQKQARAYDTLNGLIEAYEAKERTLAELYQCRIEWGKALHLLAQLVPEHIGLEEVELKPAMRRGPTGRQKPAEMSPGVLDLDGLSAGGDIMLVGEFVDALMGKPPAGREDVLGPSTEFGRLLKTFTRKKSNFVEPDQKKYIETKAWDFGVTLTLASYAERYKNAGVASGARVPGQ